MSLARILFLVLVTVGLSGCYQGSTPLIPADNAVFPYETITYRPQGSEDSKTLIHKGDAYVVQDDADEPMLMRFMAIEGDLYVAELVGSNQGVTTVLYGTIKVDFAAKTVRTYASVADETDVGPGLRTCKDGVCVDDLDAYIAHARALIDAAAEPDTTYDIIALK
jgi:hypothetical protein